MNRFSQFIPSEYVPLDTNLLLKAGMYAEQNALEDLNKINNAIGNLNAIPAKYTQDSEYLKSKLDQTRSNISGLISNTSEFTQPDFVGKINQEVYNFTNDPNIRQILNDNQHWDDVQKSRVKNPNSTYDAVLSKDLENAKNTYSNTGTLTDMTQIPYSFKHYDRDQQFVQAIKALGDNKIKTDDGYTVREVITNAYINKGSIDSTRLTNALNLVIQNNPELNKSLELDYRYQKGLGFLDPVDLNELNNFKENTILNYAGTYLKLQNTEKMGDLPKYATKLQMKQSMKEQESEGEGELTYDTKTEDDLIDESDAENELITSKIITPSSYTTSFGDKESPGETIEIELPTRNITIPKNSNLKNLSKEDQISAYKRALKNTRNSGDPLLTIYTTKGNKEYNYFNQKDVKDIMLDNIIAGKMAIRNEKGEVLKQGEKSYPTDIKKNFIFAGYNPIKGYFKYVHGGTNKNYYVETPQSFLSANEIIKNINNSRFRIGNRFINVGNGKQVMTYTDILANDITNPNATLNTVVYDQVYTPSEFDNLDNKDNLLYKVYSKEGEEINVDYNKAPNDAKIVVTENQTKGTAVLTGKAIDDYNKEIFKYYYKQLKF